MHRHATRSNGISFPMERTPINPISTTHAQARGHCKGSATLGRRVGSHSERDLRCFTSAQLGSLDRTHTEQVTTGQTKCRQRHPLHHCVAGRYSKIVRWHKDHAWYHCVCLPAPPGHNGTTTRDCSRPYTEPTHPVSRLIYCPPHLLHQHFRRTSPTAVVAVA